MTGSDKTNIAMFEKLLEVLAALTVALNNNTAALNVRGDVAATATTPEASKAETAPTAPAQEKKAKKAASAPAPEAPKAEEPTKAAPAPVATPEAPKVTREELVTAAKSYLDKTGDSPTLKAIAAKFGAPKISAIEESKIADAMKEVQAAIAKAADAESV